MRREIVKSENLAAPVGPYSVGTVYENLIFLSGCTAQDPETGLLIGETIEAQTQQTLINLLTALKAAGGNKETVLKVNCYLRTMDHFNSFNTVYKQVFNGDNFPARTCIAAAELPLNSLVEVEAIAYRE